MMEIRNFPGANDFFQCPELNENLQKLMTQSSTNICDTHNVKIC